MFVVADCVAFGYRKLRLGPDSGHRACCPARVRELTGVFVAGGFGQAILSDVSVLQKTDADDRYRIDDGLATVTALSQLLTLYNKAVDDADNDAQWPHNLVEIFESGIPVNFVAYERDEVLLRRLWNVSKHSEDNNKHRQSGVYDCMKTASDYLSQHGDAAVKDHTHHALSTRAENWAIMYLHLTTHYTDISVY